MTGRIKILKPNGGEIWARGSSCDISWKIEGDIFEGEMPHRINGEIDLINKNGKVFKISDITFYKLYPDRKFKWTVGTYPGIAWLPGIADPDTSYKIRVRTKDGKYEGDSGQFTIALLQVGENWINPIMWMGSRQEIPFRFKYAKGYVAFKLIRRSDDVMLMWPREINNISNGDPEINHHIHWTIPKDLSPGDNYRISAELLNSECYNESPKFSIGKLYLTAPNSQSKWLMGQKAEITWECSHPDRMDHVKLDLLKGGSIARPIHDFVPNNNYYKFNLFDNIQLGDDYQIRISSLDGSVLIEGDKFSIKAPQFKLTSPTTQSRWCVGRTEKITWESSYPAENYLIFRLERGDHAVGLIAKTPGTKNSLNWTVVGAEPGKDYRVRVYDCGPVSMYENLIAESDGPFIIHPKEVDIPHNVRSSWRRVSRHYGSIAAHGCDNAPSWPPYASGQMVVGWENRKRTWNYVLYTAYCYNGFVYRGIIDNFDLSPLQEWVDGNIRILEAKIEIEHVLIVHDSYLSDGYQIANPYNEAFPITLCCLIDPWDDDDLTAAAWIPGPRFGKYGKNLIDITGIVQEWLEGLANYGVMLKGDNESLLTDPDRSINNDKFYSHLAIRRIWATLTSDG